MTRFAKQRAISDLSTFFYTPCILLTIYHDEKPMVSIYYFRPVSIYYIILYNNTCLFCIFIGRELCVIKVHTHEWRQLMAWSNLANLFRGSSHDFCQLYYNIKQIDFIFLCFCTVIDHRWRHSVWRTKITHSTVSLFCSSHAMTSSVIYRVSQKNPKTIENDVLLEFQCLALNWTHEWINYWHNRHN